MLSKAQSNILKKQLSKVMEFRLLIILQFIAHFLADFYFQSQKWCDRKESKVISKIHCYHCLIVFALSYLLSFDFAFWWVALIISVSHLLIDTGKSYCLSRNYLKKHLFFIDQILHIIVIFCMCYLYMQNSTLNTENNIDKYAYILLMLIICGKPSNVFIKKFLESNKIEIKKNTRKNENILIIREEEEGLLHAGRVIGVLERVISFILIIFNQFAAVGFLIAAKSILRFRDTERPETEYLLIGSLLSFGIAIVSGLLFQIIN
jgi:hypothetical protein